MSTLQYPEEDTSHLLRDTVQQPESYIPDHLEKDISIYLILYVIRVHNMKYKDNSLRIVHCAISRAHGSFPGQTLHAYAGLVTTTWIVVSTSPARRRSSSPSKDP